MLIGISGKMGSGKNLVCTIIQGLTAAKKHNIENPSFEWIKKYYINSIWEQKAFAGKLKDMVCMLIGCTREQLEDQEFKNTELGEEWIQYFDSDYELLQKESVLSMFSERLTPRKLLQLLGTECGRNILHPNVWVNALMSQYKMNYTQHPDIDYIEHKVYPNWIITDMRFPNELEAIKSRGGITIRVNRPKNDLDNHKDCVKTEDGYCIQSENNYCKGSCKYEHPSETSLDSATFDFVISNDKDIEHLINEVRKILEKLNII